MTGRVLIIDDEKNIRKTVEMIHRNAGWQAASAANGTEALAQLEHTRFDIVYLDLVMPEKDGIEILRDIKERWPDQLVVILTGNATIERAVGATKLGAFDFLEKDCGKEKILLTSKNALEYRSLTEENRMLRTRIAGRRVLLGSSRVMQNIAEQLSKVAPSNARVLILGESGTGKELIAQAIHDRSQRSAGPFIKVNCAAIPEELIEAELFGSVKGAFTGAETREGKFQAAHGGTLLLDEIGDMSLRVQTKVLRTLQEGEISKVGSNQTIRVDVRIIAATNKNLGEEVAKGTFREDLYFRLNVVPIVAPPLREHAEDIPLLAKAFVEEYCEENGVPSKKLDDPVVEILKRYPWPGNVRELRNQIERLVIMSPGRTIRIADLSAEIRMGPASFATAEGMYPPHPSLQTSAAQFAPSHSTPITGSLQDAKRTFERTMILHALHENDWNISRAAQQLGLERTNLHKKIRQLNLRKDSK
ncbi:MAG: sigma-54 dependent transcriptional regulator [Candidatus Krumholzibacteria bacterium]|nr:sigma-54 dependent transcriptional regulator [Candidatus Krumholzibacteria bacterium]